MRIAFYVSGNAGRLRKIIAKKEKYLSQVKLVISDSRNNCDIEKELKAYNISYILLDYRELEGEKNIRLSNNILELLLQYKIDYCFSFGDHILKGELLKCYKNRIINFHPSILPFFKGRKAIDQAVSKKTFLVGCSAHFIDEGVDTGMIIMQSVMPMEVFELEGYDGILDTQLKLLDNLILVINENRLQICDNKVKIKGADYTRKYLFPSI